MSDVGVLWSACPKKVAQVLDRLNSISRFGAAPVTPPNPHVPSELDLRLLERMYDLYLVFTNRRGKSLLTLQHTLHPQHLKPVHSSLDAFFVRISKS
mmetsp:Transcript_36547/g.146094  ORF Transcript_36547/g.146094 Transcript_36547/m.146094 type:complete len:97 (+) Transcript_36547:250-540(+)